MKQRRNLLFFSLNSVCQLVLDEHNKRGVSSSLILNVVEMGFFLVWLFFFSSLERFTDSPVMME